MPPTAQELGEYRVTLGALMARCLERVRRVDVGLDVPPQPADPALPHLGADSDSPSATEPPPSTSSPTAEPWSLGAAQLARDVAARTLTPTRIVVSLLDRIAKLDPSLHSFVRVTSDRALQEAALLTREAAAGQLRGPLHGVPIGVKDILYTAGIETNAGSPLLAGFVPPSDAAVVARLRAAGAIVLGKNAMTEFAAMDPAPTRNPWNLEHTPGGSSSGSAAAVAACLAPAALGTQTAGSILRPAAYCGVVGLKPTYDAVSRDGVFPCAWSMDHVGPLTRSVEDAALMFGVMSGAAPAAFPSPGRALRFGIADRYFDAAVDADTRAAFSSLVDKLRSAGAEVVPVRLPERFEAGTDAGIVVVYAEIAAVHRQRIAVDRDRYGWRIACLIDAGAAVSAGDYLRAQQVRKLASDDLSALLSGIDCLITPSTPAPAPRGLALTGDWTHNMPFSSSGHPALSVPIALSGAGLPIGAQLVARYRGEALLFRCGALVERLVDFPRAPL